ncbi:MAG: NAD(+) synthase [Anaerolineales bacterium]|nr:NAD(+) synthase [Anaerolineales bacterium]
MDWTKSALTINPSQTIQEILTLIEDRFKTLNRKVAVLGLSGGLDSSVVASLAVKCLGKDQVKLYYLPERDSKPLHRNHAILLADQLEADLTIIKITPALRALHIYRLLPLSYFPGYKLRAHAVNYGKKQFLSRTNGEFLSTRLAATGGPWVAQANAYISAKHRIRMLALYKEAERFRGLVIGAANKTEWMTGTFTQWGCDHCADLMPILHLYRTQLVSLAKHLQLPDEILRKKADPDVLPGLDDKGELLGSFQEADLILWGLENQIPLNQLEGKFGKEKISYILTLVKNSAYFRESPYSLL